ERGSAPAALQWRKNLALLVYLARSPRGTRTREHLIGLLWGDKPESTARHSLNTALSLLRGYAGEDSVASDGTRVTLGPGGVQLDTEQLEAFVANGDLAAAVALIKGEFLEGFSIKDASQFDDWMTAEREHWRRRSVEVLLNRALAAQVRLERTWRLPKAAAAEAKRAPLVGRARELGQLVEAWTTCRRDRHPALAVIDGDAGAGKTRLAEELVARARLDGAVVA